MNVREGERLGIPSSEADVESADTSVGVVDDDYFFAKESKLRVNFALGGIRGGRQLTGDSNITLFLPLGDQDGA